MRFGVLGVTLVAGLFSLMPHAKAQLSPQWSNCTGDSKVDWAEQIKACSALIESSFETTEHRVTAYIRRGIAYNSEGKFALAIADYDEAIKLKPQSGQAFYNRGNTYWAEGDNAHAIADFTSATQFEPQVSTVFRARSLAYLYDAKPAQALTDISKAHELDPGDPYTALWADIIAQRNNAPSHLSESLSPLDPKQWPSPLIRMYLGKITPAALLAALDKAAGSKKDKEGPLCEGNFYIAEWMQQHNSKADAARLFKLAASTCPRDYLEWGAATAELRTAGAAH